GQPACAARPAKRQDSPLRATPTPGSGADPAQSRVAAAAAARYSHGGGAGRMAGRRRLATWRSGYAAVCKTVYAGSIPAVASTSLFYNEIFSRPANFIAPGLAVPTEMALLFL